MREIRCTGRAALMPDDAAAVAEAVRDAGVILFPTDTLYGLGADPFSAAGLASIFHLKGREPDKPLPVLIADATLLSRYAAAIPPAWRTLMARFWPGPLTLLFPALPDLPAGIRSAEGKVALRLPGSALCRSVLRAAGGSLTGTSANAAGAGGTGDPAEALRGLAGAVDVLVNSGTLPPSPVSTLLDMDASGSLIEVRAGAIALSKVRRALEGAGMAVDKPPPPGV